MGNRGDDYMQINTYEKLTVGFSELDLQAVGSGSNVLFQAKLKNGGSGAVWATLLILGKFLRVTKN